MAIELTLTIKITSLHESRDSTDTFILQNVTKEDVTKIFQEDFVSLCMGDTSGIFGYEIPYEECITKPDNTVTGMDNNFQICHYLISGSIQNWKVLTSKTKVKTLK